MQGLFAFIVMRAQYLGSIVFQSSMMKQIFLVLLMTVSFSEAIEWHNEFTLSAVCDNSTMHVKVNFTKDFEGAVYQSRGFYNPKCSFTVPYNSSVTQVDISMPFSSCEISIEALDNRTVASTEVTIQLHNLLDSIYDRTANVSCEIDNYQPANESTTEEPNPYAANGLSNSWMELKQGLVFLGEIGEPMESNLYMIINVLDDGSNRDMIVQNCIAHTDKNVTNTTNLLQLSNFYGCPESSDFLSNFTFLRPGIDQGSMSAYASFANFSLLVSGGRMSITCGITICEDACPAHCSDPNSPVQLPLSDYVTKTIVTRNDGAVMPDSLRELNRHNDRSRRTPNRPKRSIRSFLSRIFSWESHFLAQPASGSNSSNITETGVAKGLVVRHTVVAKDVLVSSGQVTNTTNKTLNLADQFHMDWQTFRFIALMATCMFITVTACYCCYTDESKKRRNSQYVF